MQTNDGRPQTPRPGSPDPAADATRVPVVAPARRFGGLTIAVAAVVVLIVVLLFLT